MEPDPFNAAALINTSSEISSKKSLNLFQRVTGIGKRAKETSDKPTESRGDQDNRIQAQNNELSDSKIAKNNTAERIAETAEPSKKAIDDSALDIPAFLRR